MYNLLRSRTSINWVSSFYLHQDVDPVQKDKARAHTQSLKSHMVTLYWLCPMWFKFRPKI